MNKDFCQLITRMPNKNKKVKSMLMRKSNIVIIFPIVVILILMLSVLVFGLGIDNKFINGSVEGYILNDKKQPVPNAQVCVETICNLTDESGYYLLSEISKGNKEMSISTRDYLDLTQTIVIKKGENIINISLTQADLKNVQIVLQHEEDIVEDNLSIIIDEQSFTPLLDTQDKKNLIVEISEVKTGPYEVLVNSDYYVDQNFSIVVETDTENIFTFNLEVAAELNIKIVDWVNSGVLSNASIILPDDTQVTTNEEGIASVPELSTKTKEIKVTKGNYLPNSFLLPVLVAGLNQDIIIELVPEGKIAFLKETVLNNQVVLSNLDGTEATQLTYEGDNSQPWIDTKNQKVFFSRVNEVGIKQIYSVDFLGEKTELISSDKEKTKRIIDLVNYQKDLRIFSEEVSEGTIIKKSRLDDSKIETVIEEPTSALQGYLLSQDGNQFIYSITSESSQANNGIYTNTLRFNRKNDLLKFSDTESMILLPVAINDIGDRLALTSNNDLFVFDYDDDSQIRYTQDGIEKTNFYFQPNSESISFIQNEGEISRLSLLHLDTKEITYSSPENVNISTYKWFNDKIFYYIADGKLWISSIRDTSKPHQIADGVTFN